MGIPNDLPGFDYLCVTGTSSTYTDFGGGGGPSSGYDISNCQVDYTSSKCTETKRYVNNTVGCSACSTGAYGSASGYHRNPTCAYCDENYRYVSNDYCVRCPSDRIGGTGPHQNDTCVCKAGLWDDGTNCNECPCSGTTAYPGDIDACYLVGGSRVVMKVALIPLKKKDNVIILDIMIKNLPVIPAFLFYWHWGCNFLYFFYIYPCYGWNYKNSRCTRK